MSERWQDNLQRLASHRREVASLCEQYPESRELFASNPALALCIACAPHWDVLRDRETFLIPLRTSRVPTGESSKTEDPGLIPKLLRTKRQLVCALLGFRKSETMVRILRKITPEACSVPLLMRLRRNLDNDALLKVLKHLPVIDEGALYLAAYWRWGEFITLPLFNEMVALRSKGMDAELFRLMSDTTGMDIQVGLVEKLPRSIAELQRLHDKLVEEITDAPDENLEWMLNMQFPPPPIPGNGKILPIETPAMLIEEGRVMHHCVAMMGYDIKEGATYIYRILEPERATLAIDSFMGGWSIGELRAAYNANVRGETLCMVQDWLHRKQQGFGV